MTTFSVALADRGVSCLPVARLSVPKCEGIMCWDRLMSTLLVTSMRGVWGSDAKPLMALEMASTNDATVLREF